MLASTRKSDGFTVIELMVVVVIVGLSTGLVLPAIQQARGKADEITSINNIKNCAIAVHNAQDQFGKFPTYYGTYGGKKTPASFHTHLLPFLDQGPLYAQEKPDPKAVVPAFLSPMDPTHLDKGAGAANYPVNLRIFYTGGGTVALSPPTALIYPKMPGSFPDGVSNTLLFATKYMKCGREGGSMWADTNAVDSITAATFGASMGLWQSAPKREACDPKAGTAVSFSDKSILVALCDGSVRSVGVGLSAATWQAVHTPGAGDVQGKDWDQ